MDAVLQHVDIDALSTEEERPIRRTPDPDQVEMMRHDLSANGLSRPLIAIRRNARHLVVVDGHVRLRAMRQLRENGETLACGTSTAAVPVLVYEQKAGEYAALRVNVGNRRMTQCERVRHVQRLGDESDVKKLYIRDAIGPARQQRAGQQHQPGLTHIVGDIFNITRQAAHGIVRCAREVPPAQVGQLLGTRDDTQRALDETRQLMRDGMAPQAAVEAVMTNAADRPAGRRQAAARDPVAVLLEMEPDDLSQSAQRIRDTGSRAQVRAFREGLSVRGRGHTGPGRQGANADTAEIARVQRRLQWLRHSDFCRLRNRDIANLAEIPEATVSEIATGDPARREKLQDTITRLADVLDRLNVPGDPAVELAAN